MWRVALSLLICAATFSLLAFPIAAPVEAQASRTWVSGVGDDANPCSRTAPCKTFAGAISKTASGGEINCLDPGGFGGVTITKPMTIDCHEIFGSVLVAGSNGVAVNFDAFSAPGGIVRLRNINFNGIIGTPTPGTNGIRVLGTNANSANSAVFVEDCLIEGWSNRGISDERSNGGELYVSNTTIRDSGQTGIVILPASGGTTIQASINNVRVQNSNTGAFFSSGSKVMISRSVFSGNTTQGIIADGPNAPTNVNISDSVLSGNGTGVANNGGTVVIRLSNNDITNNNTGFFGQTFSYTNNRTQGNASIGTAPTAIGGVTNPTGEQ